MARQAFPIMDDSAEIVVYQGDDYAEQHAFFDSAGTILNTTGWTAAMTVKESTDDTTALLSTAAGTITVVTGINGTLEASTTLSGAASAAATTITVTSATGIAAGQQIVVTLDSGSTHAANITEVAGTTVTLALALPSAAASGNAVAAYSNPYCLDILITDTNTATLPDGLVGVYDLSVTEADGRKMTLFKSSFCVETEVG